MNAVTTPDQTPVLTIRETALGYSPQRTGAMVTKLEASFGRRDQFEASNGLSLVAASSYVTERNRMLRNKVAVARTLLVLGIEPSAVIERKVAESAMFNAKALKKVTEIAQFICGAGARLERVTRAFIACALIATERNVETITNEVNRRFLCGADFSGRLTDQDLIDHLDELRHRAMTSGAETQSSQARNVLDALGLGSIVTVNKARDAIVIEADHEFYTMFRAEFMK
jgi:hypothetical protein